MMAMHYALSVKACMLSGAAYHMCMDLPQGTAAECTPSEASADGSKQTFTLGKPCVGKELSSSKCERRAKQGAPALCNAIMLSVAFVLLDLSVLCSSTLGVHLC